jgi:hypothetical protein
MSEPSPEHPKPPAARYVIICILLILITAELGMRLGKSLAR